jgi:hypothetical protein
MKLYRLTRSASRGDLKSEVPDVWKYGSDGRSEMKKQGFI